jgi:HAE1 family hydrophobic/amphiphilic exporter-1
MQTLARICIERPVFAVMLALSLVVAGLFSFLGLGVDLLPKIDLPVVTVTVIVPGGAAQEIEAEVTKKIEDAVTTVGGIDSLKSTSVEGVSITSAQFSLETDGDKATQQVRDAVSAITDLPATARPPRVQKLDTGATPVIRVALSANRPLEEVTAVAEERIQKAIEGLSGVASVQILGGAKNEVRIKLDPDRLMAHRISVAEVARALQTQNMEVPAGRINEGARELSIRTMGRLSSLSQLDQIAVAHRGERVIRLSELGAVSLESGEQRTASLLNGKPAVTLVVQKQSDENTVDVATQVKDRLREIEPTLGKDYKIEMVSDQSLFIKMAVEAIEHHLVIGSLLAGLVCYFFLNNLRSTLIAAVAIPISLIATFAMMAAVGYTLNQVTMLALTLMIGIVIDDAIVVLENIYRFVEEKGMDPMKASIEATREIGLAVLATTLSLMAVFLPIAFMKGIVGRVMSSFGLTSAFAVGVSMFVSFSLTPMLCSRLIRRESPLLKRPGEHASKASGFYSVIESTYMRMLAWSMHHRKTVVAICVLVVLSTLPLFLVVGKNFTPTDDQSAFNVTLRTAEGSSLASTSLLSERMATELRGLPAVIATLNTVGSGSTQQVNEAAILVKLAPIEERAHSQDELITQARALLAKYPKNLHLLVQAASSTGGSGATNADIQFLVRGPENARLEQYSNQLTDKLRGISDAVDVESSLSTGKPSVFVEIDRDRAADLGVSVADIAQTLNAMVASQEITTFDPGSGPVPLRIQAAASYLTGSDGLERISVPSTKLGLVALSNVTRLVQTAGPAAIARQERTRSVLVTAGVKPGGSQAAVISEAQKFADSITLDPGYTIGTAGASKELARAAYYFLLAIVLAFVFMYLVLASQFESFIEPLIILATLPMAVPCGIVSLLLTGQSFNLFAALGMLLLFGVVKKNAILQLDHTNTLRREHKLELMEAIMQANRDRLRPILMTTLALVAGMAPLVISSGTGAGTNRAIGVVVMGGQSLCLLLTLLAVPVLYSIVEDWREANLAAKLFSRWRPAARATGAAQ